MHGLVLALAALVTACAEPARKVTTPPRFASTQPSESAPSRPAAERTTLRFATAAEGKALLAAEDDFTRALSAFDRSFRMKRVDSVSDAELRRFAGEQALDFTEDEKNEWGAALDELRRAIDGFQLGLPPTVLIVKTTGREELEAAYTRRNAIILPASMVAESKGPSRVGLIAHELFHVSSRASPPLRDRRYALLAFTPMPAISPPRDLESARLTNPDAHGLDHYLRVTADDGREHAVVPILTCNLPLAKAITSQRWFESIRVVLIEVDPREGTALVDPAGRTRTLDAKSTDWERRLGKNTGYVLDPEEVLADNFALVVKRRLGHPTKPSQPDFLDRLESALR